MKPPGASGVLSLHMKRLLAIACLLVLSGLVLFLVLRRSEPPPAASVVVMPLPYSIPRQKVSLFDRWVPRQSAWKWLWAVKDGIVGRPSQFDLRATIVDFAGAGEAFLTNHPLPAPAYTATNGFRIWLLSADQERALAGDLRQKQGPEILSMPSISTAAGRQASLMATTRVMVRGSPTQVGLTIDLLPRVRRDVSDITTIIYLTEAITNRTSGKVGSPASQDVSIRTKFAVAARLQVPKGSGVFLLDGEPAAPDQERIGVLFAIQTSKSKR